MLSAFLTVRREVHTPLQFLTGLRWGFVFFVEGFL